MASHTITRGVGTDQFGQAMAWPLLALANPTIKSYEYIYLVIKINDARIDLTGPLPLGRVLFYQ